MKWFVTLLSMLDIIINDKLKYRQITEISSNHQIKSLSIIPAIWYNYCHSAINVQYCTASDAVTCEITNSEECANICV